jgi:hypothetical protein
MKRSKTKLTRRKTWITPQFEFEDLCCEVTLYLYHQ